MLVQELLVVADWGGNTRFWLATVSEPKGPSVGTAVAGPLKPMDTLAKALTATCMVKGHCWLAGHLVKLAATSALASAFACLMAMLRTVTCSSHVVPGGDGRVSCQACAVGCSIRGMGAHR